MEKWEICYFFGGSVSAPNKTNKVFISKKLMEDSK